MRLDSVTLGLTLRFRFSLSLTDIIAWSMVITTHVVGVPLTRLSVPTARMQDGNTALMHSAKHGELEVAKLLIERGARVQHENKVSRGKGLERGGVPVWAMSFV